MLAYTYTDFLNNFYFDVSSVVVLVDSDCTIDLYTSTHTVHTY